MNSVISPVKNEERSKLGIQSGDTVRVVQNIVELKKGRGADKKEKTIKNMRKQTFEGLVIAVKHGTEAGGSFTVRTTLSGIGVEKTFPLYTPLIDKIEIVKRSKVRRAKLYFIREKAAKAVRRQLRNARMMNLSTDDFAHDEEEVKPETEGVEEAPVTVEDASTEAAAEEAPKEGAAKEAPAAKQAEEASVTETAEAAPAEEPEEKKEEFAA